MKTSRFTVSLSLCLLFLFCMFIGYASSQLPSLPYTVKGNVLIDGNPAPVETTITAKLGDVQVSEFNITIPGVYALGIETPPENHGKTAKLYVNGIDANASVVIRFGQIDTADLSVRTPINSFLPAVLALALVAVIISIAVYIKNGRKSRVRRKK